MKQYTFDKYQRETGKTAVYPKIGNRIVYPVLGLVGEAGEVAEKVKKMFRDKSGRLNKGDKDLLKKEIGDVLWYISQLSTELGLSLSDVAADNIAKLKSRMKRDKLHGSGDKR